MQLRLSGLSALDKRLWTAFKLAEKKFVPAVFNPVLVTSNLMSLRRHGYLRWFEFYPIYATLAGASAVLAVFGHPWMFVWYIAALALMFVFLSKYVKRFAFEKTNVLGLVTYSFGVPHLPLLVYGISRNLEEAGELSDGVDPAPYTKENLASVIKLVKGGHEHGEIGYGFDDVLKKWLYGSIASVFLLAFNKADEIVPAAVKLRHAFTGDAVFWAMAAIVVASAAYLIYRLVFSPANVKRRNRRYLLAMNVIHETWAGEDSANPDACSGLLAPNEESSV